MRPAPDVWQEPSIVREESARPQAEPGELVVLKSLTEEQRQLIAVLQTHEHGMTARQLQTELSRPRKGVDQVLKGLLDRRLVARLNTIVPSYVYRYEGVNLGNE